MNNTTFIKKIKIKHKLELKTIKKYQTQKYLKKKEKTGKFYHKNKLEKSEHRESSRLRNQPPKNHKTFIPQSKIFKKLNFINNFDFKN